MSGGQSFGFASVHVGAEWEVRCSAYPDSTPIFTVDAGFASVSVSIAGQEPVSAETVRFAREFARQAGRFAAECERLRAAQEGQASDGTAASEGNEPPAEAA